MPALKPGDRHFTPGLGWGVVRAPAAPVSVTKAPAAVLNQQRPIQETQKNVTAENRVVPIVYGQAQVGGMIFALDYTDGTFTIGYLIAQGEIEGFVNVYMDDAAPPAGVAIDYYTGAPGQTANAKLQAAITGYSDTLDGLAYIVIQYSDGVFTTWPQVVAEIQGRKVYDPRTTLTAYSENPALHLGDLLSSTDYGAGYTVDPTALTATADACDDTTGIGEARRQSFSVLDTPRRPEAWADVLRTYAGCFVVYRGRTAYLVPDRPAATAATFTESEIIEGSLRIKKKAGRDLPTVIQVLYTDTSGNEWRERKADEVADPMVGSGKQRRVSQVRLPGITRHSQAYREAVERLNALTLSDLEVQFDTFDEAIDLEMGDVIAVTHGYGLTAKTFRLTKDPQQVSPGRWTLVGQEYDAAAYSDEVITQPTAPDTTLPVNGPPPAPASVTLGETTYQLQNGKYASRIDISWPASAGAYVTGYSVQVKQGGAVVWATQIDSTSVSTSPLTEGVPYTVQVRAVTALYTGDPVTDTYTIIGKTAIPDAPASISGFEAGGQVRLSWPASTDIDAERYEIRYGSTGGSWETATVIDVTDALRITATDIPEGTQRFYVKTIDSIRQYSAAAASVDIVVTLDNDAFTADQLSPLGVDSVNSNNVRESFENRGDTEPVVYTESAQTWDALFPNAMSTYTSPVYSYQSGVTGLYWSPAIDVLTAQAMQLQRSGIVYGTEGTVPLRITHRPGSSGAWTYDESANVVATARQARINIQDADAFYIDTRTGLLRALIVAKEETGSDTSLSGGRTITLSKQYAAARSIVITPEGSSAYTATFDNIVLDNGGVTTFDVYIFNSSGVAQNSVPFRWQWKGV